MTDNKFKFIDEWRPSRIRAVSKGNLYWTEVDVFNISDKSTAEVIRTGLEPFGIKVNYFEAGLADHVKKVLGGNEYAKAPHLIIAAHGAETEGNLSIGKLDGQLAETQDFNENITPDDLKKFLNVSDKVVINTACGGAEKRLVDVFMNEGKAKAYIADNDAPFGYVSSLFPILLFYFLTQYPDISLKEAFDRAQRADEKEFSTWKYFEKI